MACTGCGVPKRPHAQVRMQARWVWEVPEEGAVWLHPDLCTSLLCIFSFEVEEKMMMISIYDLSF